MMAQWNDRYKTGHPEVDAQHQKLFLLVNNWLTHHIGEVDKMFIE